jgi:Tetratricopeptide repeat
MRQLFVTLVLVGAAGAAWGESSLTTELEAVATRYHENPVRLDTVRETLEQAAGAKPEVDTLVALAHVCFICGDVCAATAEQKLEAYDQGRQAARRWFATNTARWGQTKGILPSLFLLPTVQEEIQTVLELDPGFTAVYALAGNVYYEVPGILGGDLDLAEQMFMRGLEQDPKFTGMRVGLGKTLIKKGRITDARRELQAVLEETAPTNPADWALKDAQEARALLESIRSKSS